MKKSLATAVLLAAVLSLTACGSPGNPNAGLPSGTATNPADRAVAFAQCMRQHGVQVPDPNPQSSGLSIPGNVDQGTLNAAEQACAKYDIKRGASGETPAEQDRNLKLAKCLRQHGLNVPDPKPGQGLMIGPGTGSGSGAGSDGSGSHSQLAPNNGDTQQIMQECEQQVGKGGK
jgi:hypothetical protein